MTSCAGRWCAWSRGSWIRCSPVINGYRNVEGTDYFAMKAASVASVPVPARRALDGLHDLLKEDPMSKMTIRRATTQRVREELRRLGATEDR